MESRDLLTTRVELFVKVGRELLRFYRDTFPYGEKVPVHHLAKALKVEIDQDFNVARSDAAPNFPNFCYQTADWLRRESYLHATGDHTYALSTEGLALFGLEFDVAGWMRE